MSSTESKQSPAPLERERELSCIRQVLAGATAGSGELLVIEGPSGIGKSRLLNEARALAADAGMQTLYGRGGELERDYAFGLVFRLLEPLLARAGAAERRRLLRGRAALASPLLSPIADDVRLAATTDEFALIHGLYWCVVNLSEQRPAALLVDDVHWGDDLSLRFLIYLADRLEDLPVALVVAVRTGDPSAESALVTRLCSAPADRCLRPAELSPAAVGELFSAAQVPAAASDELVHASWRATRGNPFLVQELVAAMRAEGDAGLNSDPSRMAGFAPQSVRRRVVLRLGALGADALALARACAVLGDDTPLLRAAQLAGVDPAAATAAAERLVAAEILSAGDSLSFSHPMIRSAVHDDLPPGDRPRAHATAARLLEHEGAAPELVSHHLLAATPTDEPWVRNALHAGARAAARKGAPATAVRYLRRALDLCPAGEQAAAMLIDLGLVEAAAGETTSLARFEAALAMIEEPAEQARALYALGQTLYRYGRHREAAATFRRGAELFEGDRELALMFEGAFMCAAYYVAPLHDDTIARTEAIAAGIRRGGALSTAERVVLVVLSLHRAMTMSPGAGALVVEALGDGALLREQTSESMAANLAIVALLHCGRTEDAQDAADAVLADAHKRGAALAFAEASMTRALVTFTRGRVTDAAVDAQAAIDGRERGFQAMGPMPHAILAQCLIERGELEGAETVLDAAKLELTPAEAPGPNAFFYIARGRLRLLRRDPGGALDDFLAAGHAIQPYGTNAATVPWRVLAGVAAHALGDDKQAAALLDEEITLAREFGLAATLGAALRARAAVKDDRAASAELEEARAVLEGANAPLELARTLLDLGRAHRHAGQRVASREPLRRALDLAHQCGATALEREARDELLASGARPRRPASTGIEALTPSERRVAELAAAGHGNRDIAEMLFLTRNTVAWHLRNIYRKLDVESRPALEAKLEGERRATAGV